MTKKILLIMLAWSMILPAGYAQDGNQPGNSRFVLTLNDSNIDSLKSLGMIESRPLQPSAIGKIAAIQLQFDSSSNGQAVLTDTNVNVDGSICQVTVNDAVIELARQQPVRIEVPAGASFSRVLFKYEATGLEYQPQSSNPGSRGSSSMKVGIYRHFVKLSENKTIAGQMDLSKSVKFLTKFGDVDISMGQIRGIRFHIDGDDAAIIVLNNGDTITGVPQSDSFSMATDWGRAELDVVFVESITTSPGAVFRQSNDPRFGPRWELIGN